MFSILQILSLDEHKLSSVYTVKKVGAIPLFAELRFFRYRWHYYIAAKREIAIAVQRRPRPALAASSSIGDLVQHWRPRPALATSFSIGYSK